MSAFMVENRTISTIATHLCRNRDFHRWQDTPPEVLAGMLHAMNKAGVEARYGEGDSMASGTFEYCPAGFATKIQLFKMLQCLIYQCSEGDVPEMELFKQIEAAKEHIAYSIIAAMPEYDKANWG